MAAKYWRYYNWFHIWIIFKSSGDNSQWVVMQLESDNTVDIPCTRNSLSHCKRFVSTDNIRNILFVMVGQDIPQQHLLLSNADRSYFFLFLMILKLTADLKDSYQYFLLFVKYHIMFRIMYSRMDTVSSNFKAVIDQCENTCSLDDQCLTNIIPFGNPQNICRTTKYPQF